MEFNITLPAVGAASGSLQPLGTRHFTVPASGSDVGATADNFHFDCEPMMGDFDAIVRVTRLDNSGNQTLGGFMLRQNLTPDSSERSVTVTPLTGSNYDLAQFRAGQGGLIASLGVRSGEAAVELGVRLKRLGQTILETDHIRTEA